ncbi:ClpXP protease specificity-enhancing factor SspB [Microvirga sp. W0021]|uniref:ClpXP protease specificity-enhancing factor SspB n=1 Tax=Hohaiivirga grylli TaxID=3133970 RepID=A0ABV0BL62_9HYPH
MATDLIRYDLLVQDALKGVVRKVLSDAAKNGLPGDHHFYVSFYTGHPGVHISSRLLEKYPQEMTIVVQHQFWDLHVGENAFEIGLSFSNIPERLHIPYDALTGFFDPSVQFGLKFNNDDDELEDDEGESAETIQLETEFARRLQQEKENASTKSDKETIAQSETDGEKVKEEADKDASKADAEVISLDAFRKK